VLRLPLRRAAHARQGPRGHRGSEGGGRGLRRAHVRDVPPPRRRVDPPEGAAALARPRADAHRVRRDLRRSAILRGLRGGRLTRENSLPLSSLMLGGSLYVVFIAYVLWSVLG